MWYDLGIVVPVYRSKESVRLLVKQLKQVFEPEIRILICLVDDSNDETVSKYLEKYCSGPEVTVVTLAGNFGQQAALLCGLRQLEHCRFYGCIDDDLQQPVKALYRLYKKALMGYDVVYGIPKRGGVPRPFLRELGSRMRDVLFSCLLGVPRGMRVGSLRVMNAAVVKRVVDRPDGSFFYLSAEIYRDSRRRPVHTANLFYRPRKRLEGKSGYCFFSLVKLWSRIFMYYVLKVDRGKSAGELYHRKEVTENEKIDRETTKEMAAKPRLMMLGGSNCQLHGMERAKQQGIDTLLVDYTQNPPAASLAGVHEQISTYDVESCIRAARKYGITGVMTMGTDQPVYTAACVSEALGLPTLISREEAFAVTNKKRMKEILTGEGIPTAAYRIVSKATEWETLRELKGPYVLKPLDSQGQRGIFKLKEISEVAEHLDETLSFSRCREALVEEFYESDEMTVSGWVKDGVLHILTVTDRLHCPDSVHIGVCSGHRFPTVHMHRYEEIADISHRTAAAFGMQNGPFYLQLLIGEKGIYVNELASRIGGAFEDVLIPEITGFDILKAVMDCALGSESPEAVPEGFRPDKSKVCAVVVLLFCKPGEIGSITPRGELLALPGVLDAGYNYQKGQEIPVMENATARFGHGVIVGDKENIRERVDAFYQSLSVQSKEGEEMVQRFQL